MTTWRPLPARRPSARSPLKRFLRRAALGAAGVVAALAVAVGTGLPDPVLAGRAATAVLGLLAVAVVIRVLAAALPRPLPVGRLVEATTTPRRQAERREDVLERELRFAATSALDYHVRIRPVLEELARTRLARRGVRLGEERARAVLGEEGYRLVETRAELPDRLAPGVDLGAVERLLERLEELR